ncbi:abasic site processing protein HMCES-like, partial [Homarus americanus]
MCGRTACTLGPDELCKACSTQIVTSDGKKQYQAPQWQDHPGNYSYTPSCNMAPSRFTPVMISEHHVRGTKRAIEGEGLSPQYVIHPMMWGLIPPYYKGSSRTGHGYSTTNCRYEGIEEKKTYKPSLTKGQRCVVLCDGFYEWQTTKGDKNKQPYFIHAPQPEGVEIWNRESWDKPDVWSEEEGWK